MYPFIYRTARLLWSGGQKTRQHLQQLEQNQWLSAAELRALELAEIQKLVRHAYQNVPFYRDRYTKAGIQPNDIKSLEDFQKLPFLTRQDVNDNLEALIAENYPRQSLHSNETGGSTGEPVHFFIENGYWWSNIANIFRVRGWHGVKEGDKVAWVWGNPKDLPSWHWRDRLRILIKNERHLNAFGMTEENMRNFAQEMVRWRPVMFKAYSSALTLFAQFLKDEGITGIRPRHIETTAEKLTTPQRQLLEEVFKCNVADYYSCRELGLIAYQCEKGGFHVTSDMRYLEIVSDGQVVPPGQMGETAVTSFTHYAMPFIRYKNGDMAIYEDTDRCECGRSFPRLKELVGRTHDYLVTADGQFVHGEFFAYTFRVKPEVVRFQVYQPDPTHLKIRLVCNQPVTEAWLSNAKTEIQTRFGPETQITLDVVDEIELTPAGKHRYIISDVKPDFI